jgi:hypothetical protein
LDGSLFNNTIFYVMSGTGNTYRMACWMKEIANTYMEDIKIVMIDEADAENETPHPKTLWWGFFFLRTGLCRPGL